ncbi:hypothetical protein EIP86_003705 [Pleurotus ostreatoroseus]|nr:hypothetical protein EIP86_003705 [Pleurotus ostreatoroseus]
MPGKFRPTPTHSFVKLLHNRKLLRMCYTQNIDTLERLAGLPDEAIVEAHGSFATQHCIECGSWYDEHKLRDQILRGEVACCDECGGLVKPDIVFFGESLPERFHKTIGLLRNADLLIIMGTSLKVHPFATLTQLVPEGCPRVLVNLDPAGDIGTRPDDVVLLGKSDDIVRELCKELGQDWVDELDALWKETEKYAHVKGAEAEVKQNLVISAEGKVPRPELEARNATAEAVGDETVQEEMDKIAEEIEKALHIGAVPTDVFEDVEPEPQTKGKTKEEKSAAEDEVIEDADVTNQISPEAKVGYADKNVEVKETAADAEPKGKESDTSKTAVAAAENLLDGKL